MAVSRMVLTAPRRSLPLKLAAVLIVAAAAVLLAQVLVHQVPGPHSTVRTSAAHTAAGSSQPGTAGGATGSFRAAPALPALPAAKAAPAANLAPAANAVPAAKAAPAGAASSSGRIATIAPPSSDSIDGGGGRIASGGAGQPVCSAPKNCK